MSYQSNAAISHDITNGENGLDKRKLFDLTPSFGDIDDVYLSSANFSDLDSNSSMSMVMSERVQRIASGIYREFETMIEAYGLPVVERLMPLIIGLLENLDELYKDQAAYHAEVGQLREENVHICDQLAAEKAARKQAELRLLQTEDTFDEERKANDAKNEALSSSCRQIELKLQLAKDQVSRLEAKEQEWKKEENRLHERLNELIRSNVELTEQIKFVNQQNNAMISAGNGAGVGAVVSTPNTHSKNAMHRLSITSSPHHLIGSRETSIHSQSPDTGYDATSSGFGFDEMPSTAEAEVCPNAEDDLPEDYPTSNSETETSEFASMRKEIDVLIKENMDLVETKNALNVVKDDLLSKIDYLTSENLSLRESVDMLTHARASLQGELTNTDQMLSDARSEITQLTEKLSTYYQENKNEESSNPSQRKRFTRSEMARILAERNHYKERLLELQDAVRFTETLRVGQKGHPDLLSKIMTTPSQQQKCDTVTPVSGPLQSLQKFFSAFTSGQRSEVVSGSMQSTEGGSSILGADVSLSWITLSAKGTHSPIYGWASGKSTQIPVTTEQSTDDEKSCDEKKKNADSDNADTDVQQHFSVPIPVQCRTIGGLHRKHLEICSALTVPIVSLDGDTKTKFHLWLIGRGGPADSHLSDSSPPTSLNRGYLGQVHIFEPTKFTQPVYSFDLDNGFLPTTAVYVKYAKESATSSSQQMSPTSSDAKIEFTWELTDSILYADNADANEKIKNDSKSGCVILASNDGRFLVFQLCYEFKSDCQSSAVAGDVHTHTCGIQEDQEVSTKCSIRLPHILYKFNTNSQGLVANGMISCDNYVCIGLFNSLGTSQFVCFQWPVFTEIVSKDSSTPASLKTMHKLISLPYESLSTGPLIMTSSSCNDDWRNNVMGEGESAPNDHIWLGTAGGGYCYCLSVKSGDVITSLALPNETPCLHAICIKSSTCKSSELIWLAVSGNPTICTPSKTSVTSTVKTDNVSGDDNDSNNNNNNNNNNDSDNSSNKNKMNNISGGMARLLACCPKQKCILRQIDLTAALSSMIDIEGVTDPIDLTICRLLIVPMTVDREIWFATRSGLIARLRLDYTEMNTSQHEIELPKSSSISISCHGYRRPGCNLLLLLQASQTNDSELDHLIVSVGHDYVDLRQILSVHKKSSDTDRASNRTHYINRSRQMGSGAHAIVWRLTEGCS
uniref:RH1 domain-containing protein n=1 Tax=Trichobilharzia regenti TaxID=157069 RepID=A0AA85IU69_TRIRE|nr:unnamed protein product [Trichobilharzia regenti]